MIRIQQLHPLILIYACQRMIRWPVARRWVSRLIARFRPNAGCLISKIESSRLDSLVSTLDGDGVVHLPAFIDSDLVQRIKQRVSLMPLAERFPPYRKNLKLGEIPDDVHVAEYPTEQLLNEPDIVAVANHPLIVGIAASYLGCKPTISSISVWWSFPTTGSPQEAENFHRDVDDWRFLKFFLYLTDVNENAGPHCFVRGSHTAARLLKIRRYGDSEVENEFHMNDILHFEGKPGDAFIEDTFGLHKGQPPVNANRLLLQVEYSINPIAVYGYKPTDSASLAKAYDPYVNRVFFRAGQ